ncbi:vacuolar import and degradation protein, partial [Protomyces lactucae-debilis]
LRPGRRFQGVQQSGRATYEVSVLLDHVDMDESRIAGTLRIQGLSVDHPTLTTFFEGEIVGAKHSFITHHKHWGASEKTDVEHWTRFQAFKPIASFAATRQKARAMQADEVPSAQSASSDCHLKLDHLFMRWKELHAIEEQRRRILEGVSYEGFYYICLSLVTGHISGMYFHEASELYQQLSLKPVDASHFPAYEWR